MGLHRAMSLAFVVMGFASCVIDYTESLFIIELMFLLIETAGMTINICSTVSITRLHGIRGESWIKSLHLCYGIGAFISPLLINAFGIRSYTIYGFLAIPFFVFMLVTK
jgi:hypothetical protein